MLRTRTLSRSFLYLFSFMSSAVAAFGMLCFLPDDPYIRFQSLNGTIFERLKWGLERIEFDPTPVDVVILGNSRSGAAVNSPLLEEMLSRDGKQTHIVNFSIPANGFDIQFSLAKRLLAKKSPRVIVISLADQLPRDGHQAFADIADPIDVIRAPLLINRQFARNLVYLPMRQLRSVYWGAFPEAGGFSRTWDQQSYLGSNIDTREAATGTSRENSNQADVAELEKESVQRRKELARPVLPSWLHSVEFAVNEHYIDEIIRLASKSNTKVVFLYVPFYKGFDEPFDQKWLASRGEVLNADFLKSDPTNYFDCGHAGESGSLRITEWLADNLAKLLSASEK